MRAFATTVACVMALAACQPDGSLENPDCDANGAAITDTSVGPLFLDESVGSLRVRCAAVSDTTVILPMVGWVDTLSAKRLVLIGVPVLALHEGGRVVALRLTSPGLLTWDSIEVGTSVARFANKRGMRVSQPSHSRAVLLQDRGRCGTTFELSGWGEILLPAEDDPPITGRALAAWPDSIVVRAITVSRCRDASSHLAVDSAFDAVDDSLNAAAAASDSVPLPGLTPSVALAPVPPAPTIQPAPPAANTTGIATASELAALRKLLHVPVRGVARGQLLDTYSEARGTRVHEAIDIRAPRGTPVLSAADGTLMRLFDSETGGLMVYAADPTDRFILLYGHLDRYASGVRDGMPLQRGQVIGYVGTTGNAPIGTPHLHFGILRGRPSVNWSRGVAVNPYPLLVP
ncbi:MAG: M23 family metallopeptidase [Gemmatimonadaceae bacterium]